MGGVYNSGNITNKDNYASNESSLTTRDEIVIKNFKSLNKIPLAQKTSLIALLNEIKTLAKENLSKFDIMEKNVNVSKNVIEKKLSDSNNNKALEKISKYELPSNIYSIASEQFNIYYDDVQELKYKLNIISYKSVFIKEQKDLLNQDIEVLNKYIIALQEI